MEATYAGIWGTVAWQRDALCIEPDYAHLNFFPERGESAEPARAVCQRCLVRQECADYAVEHEIVQGVWGGLSGRERRRLRAR